MIVPFTSIWVSAGSFMWDGGAVFIWGETWGYALLPLLSYSKTTNISLLLAFFSTYPFCTCAHTYLGCHYFWYGKHEPIGIDATASISQVQHNPSPLHSFENPFKPVSGTANTFGTCMDNYLNRVSMWWHVLGTTFLGIAILAATLRHQQQAYVKDLDHYFCDENDGRDP